MKKAAKIIGILAVLAGALVLAWYLRGRPFTAVGYRFYPFSREVCEIQLTVDGRETPLTADMVIPCIMESQIENTVLSVEQTQDGGVVSCKGGEYGDQPFSIAVPLEGKEPAVFTISPFVADWWDITKITLTLSVDSKTDTYETEYHFSMYHTERDGYDTPAILSENIIRMSGLWV